MTDTSYNGWTNRETWAANLWITNDEGLYESAKDRLDAVLPLARPVPDWDNWKADAGESLKDWWRELTDPDEQLMTAENILQMVRDIGDEDKINWQEIAETFLSEE